MNSMFKRFDLKGQATVEIIILLNVFILIVFILVNIFLITYNQLVVIESSSEGARYAALVWNDAAYKRNRVKICTDYSLDILEQKLKNATSGKPEIKYSNGVIKMKTSCSYKFLIPVIDKFVETEINLEHVSTQYVLPNL